MDQILRLFDLFNETAKKLAAYVPQSGDDVINLLKQLLNLGLKLDLWIADNIGISLQIILTALGRLIVLWLTFLFDLLKALVERL